MVLEGEFEFSGLDRGEPYTIRATPGDVVYIPGGAPHTYKTVSSTPGKALGVLAPGGDMERFFVEVGMPVTDHAALAIPAGPPSGAELAWHMEVAGRHGIVFLLPQEASDAAADAADTGEVAGVQQGGATGE